MSEEITELVQVQTQPAEITANLDQLRTALQERLSQYETVVTEDGVKEAKATATEINKIKQELARRRKEAADLAKAPIQEFEASVKELEQEAEDYRQQILTQVDAFEQKVRDQAQDALAAERDRLWGDREVREEHRRATVDDLAKVSALTAKGALTKKAQEAVESRVREDRFRQEQVDYRLADLEARSYRAGLAAPITREQVEQWLEADEETYEAQVERLINAELEREAKAAQVERERQERREAAQEQAAPAPTPEPETEPSQPAQQAQWVPPEDSRTATESEPGATPEPDENGNVTWTVTAVFTVTVQPGVTAADLEAETRRLFEEEAGVTTLQNVKAEAGNA